MKKKTKDKIVVAVFIILAIFFAVLLLLRIFRVI